MEYNKNYFDKINDKKILHKVKKQWVVISSALLLAIGGSMAMNATAHASANNTNKLVSQSIKKNLNNKTNSRNITNKSLTNSSVNRQASLLHQHIIANQINSLNYVHNLNNEFKFTNQKYTNQSKDKVQDNNHNSHPKDVNISSSQRNNQNTIVNVNNNPQPSTYHNTNDSTLINLNYYDWRTGQLVNAQKNINTPKNQPIKEGIMQPNFNLPNGSIQYRLADSGDNNDPITKSNNYLPNLNAGSIAKTINIPVIPSNVTNYGYWGNAHYEFTNDDTLYLFNGDMQHPNTPNHFIDPNNVLHIKTDNVVAPQNMAELFAASDGKNDVGDWSGSPNDKQLASDLFKGGSQKFNNLESADLSGMNTSNTVSMTGLFHGCYQLQNIKFGNMDTSKVRTMMAMFDDDRKITSLDLHSFNTRNCINFNQMFFDMPRLQNLDISNFVLNKNQSIPNEINGLKIAGSTRVEPAEINLGGMFDFGQFVGGGGSEPNHDDLNEITTSPNFKISDTTDGGWWNNGSSLSDAANKLNNIHWINSVTGKSISDLNQLGNGKNIGSWINQNNVKTYKLTFVNQLTGEVVGNHNVYLNGYNQASFLPINPSILPNGYKIVPNYGTTIPLSSNQTNVTVPVFNLKNIIDYGIWGSANYYLKNNGELDLTNGDMQVNYAPQDLKNHANQVDKIVTYSVKAPSNSSDVFSGDYNGFHNLSSFDFSHGFDTSVTTNMNGMFSNLNMKELNLNSLNTSDASSMNNMFANDAQLQTLGMNNFTMGAQGITNTQNMFSNDNKLESMAIGSSTVFQPNSALNNGTHWIDNKKNQFNLLDGTPHNAGIYYNYNDNDKNDFHTIRINYMFGNSSVGYHSDVFLNSKNTINKLDIPNIKNYVLDPNDPSQFTVSNNQVDVPVDEAGMWGQAQWLLDANGRLLLQNGNLDTNVWQGPNKSSVKSIVTNNVIAPNKMSDIFYGLPNTTLIDLSGIHGLNNVQDFKYMMSFNPALSQIKGLNDFTTGSNADLEHLFDRDNSLNNVNLSGMDTSKVRNISHMFESDYALENISNLNNLDTGNASDLSWMFCNDSKLTTFNPNSLITNHTKTIQSMFYGDTGLTSLDLSHADTSNVQNMSNALYGLSKLNQIKIGNKTKLYNANNQGNPSLYDKYWSNNGTTWTDLNNDTNPVAGTYNLMKLHLKFHFVLDSDNDTNYTGKPTVSPSDDIISDAIPQLTQIKVPNGYHIYNNTGVVDGNNTYSNEYQKQINQIGNNINATITVPVLPNNIQYCGMWGNAYYILSGQSSNSNLTLTLSNHDLINRNNDTNPNNHENMESNQWLGTGANSNGNSSLPNALVRDSIKDIKFNGHVNLPSDSSNLFNNMNNLSDINFNNAYTPNNGISNTSRMLSANSHLKAIDLKNLDFSKTKDMSNMFSGDSILSDITLSNNPNNKHMNNLSDISAMFSFDSDLKQIKNLSDLDVSRVSNMSDTFEQDSKLSDLNLSNWHLSSSIRDLDNMFSYDANLKSLNIANFDLNNITPPATTGMFNDDFTKPLSNNQYYKITMNKNTILDNSSNLGGYWIAPQYKNNPPYNTPRQLNQSNTNLGPDSTSTWYEVTPGNVNFINQNNAKVGQGVVWHNIDGRLNVSSIPRGYFEDGNQSISDIKSNKTYNVYVTGQKANLHVIFKDTNGRQISDYHLNGTNDIGNTVQLGRIPLGYTVINPSQLQYTFESNGISTPLANTPASNDYRTVNTMKSDIIGVKGDLANVRVNYINDSDGKNLYSYQITGQIGNSTTLKDIPKGYALDDINENEYKFLVSNIKVHQPNNDLMGDYNVYVHKSKPFGMLRVVYLDQNDNQVGQSSAIRGRIGSEVNVTDKSIGGMPVPSDYALNDNENVNNVITNPDSTIYLKVHGLNISTNVNVIRVLENSGKSSISDTSDTISGNNGDTTTISANDRNIMPNGYHVDTSHATSTPVLISNHKKSVVVFYYQANQQAGASITVNYINHGRLIKQSNISGGNIGSDKVNGISINSIINNDVPTNYSLADSLSSYSFSKNNQNINLNITGKSINPRFIIHRTLADDMGNNITSSDVIVTLHSHFGSDAIISPYLINNDQYSLSDTKHHSLNSLTPSGYHSGKNSDLMIKINNNGMIEPFNKINYVYYKNYQPSHIKTIRVHYINTDNNSEVDEESDRGTANDSFNIQPYLEDVPEIPNSYYDFDNKDVYDNSGHIINCPTNFDFTNSTNADKDVFDVYIHIHPEGNLIILNND